MRKITLAAALLAVACFAPGKPAIAQGCGPSNPNCIVPTAPPGTSTNQAASTAFVQSAIATPPLASGKIFVGSAGGVATPQTLSGDCTMTTLGVITCLRSNGSLFGSMAFQSASSVAITGGSIVGISSLGIGTPSPTALLDVNGAARIRSLTSGCVASDASGNLSTTACGIVNYTAPGTGGVSIPISQHLQKELWSDEYGSVCNGSTDDHVAFQNMINQAQILGSTANFVGTCAITTGLSITGAKGLTFQGTGWGSSALVFPPTITAIAVANTGSVTLRKFGLLSPTQAPCGGIAATGISGITFSTMTGTDLVEDIQSTCVGPVITYLGASQSWINRLRAAQGPTGTFNVVYGNVYNGDCVIENSVLGGGGVGGGGIFCNQCAGLRVINNKWQSGGMQYGFFMQNLFQDGDLFFTGNSFEGITGNSIVLSRVGTGNKFGTISIVGNEITGAIGILAATDPNGSWLSTVAISGNTIITTTGAISIDSTQNLSVVGNTILCNGGIGVASGAANNRVVIGPNSSSNTAGSAYCSTTAGGTNVTTYAP